MKDYHPIERGCGIPIDASKPNDYNFGNIGDNDQNDNANNNGNKNIVDRMLSDGKDGKEQGQGQEEQGQGQEEQGQEEQGQEEQGQRNNDSQWNCNGGNDTNSQGFSFSDK